MLNLNSVKAKCRNCGKESEASEFVLDPVFKMMVCPNCVKERKSGRLNPAEKQEMPAKPAGRDDEDEYLDRATRQKNTNQVKATRIDGEHVKFNCPKCSYEVTYNKARKLPGSCPYCSARIAGMR